jgi:hypothetical protein
MLSPPGDLADTDVRAALSEHWQVSPRELRYEPVGFGSHHWVTEELFITVDFADDALSLADALSTATALREDAGLSFVVAPIPAASGSLLQPATSKWVMHVYPRLTIVGSTSFGPHTDPRAVELVRSIHAATPVVAQHVRTEDFSISHRDVLEAALDGLDEPWDTGPYGERARQLLVQRAVDVRHLLDVHDELAGAVPTVGWVVTHGEPHRGNIFKTTLGWAVVDWDTVLLAPSERDLWDLPVDCDVHRRQLYRLRWDLAEIAAYVSRFFDDHTGDLNDDKCWAGLLTYIDTQARWPELM